MQYRMMEGGTEYVSLAAVLEMPGRKHAKRYSINMMPGNNRMFDPILMATKGVQEEVAGVLMVEAGWRWWRRDMQGLLNALTSFSY
jgi:hypothetical protein